MRSWRLWWEDGGVAAAVVLGVCSMYEEEKKRVSGRTCILVSNVEAMKIMTCCQRTCAQVSEAAWRSMPVLWVQFNAGSMASCHAVRVR